MFSNYTDFVAFCSFYSLIRGELFNPMRLVFLLFSSKLIVSGLFVYDSTDWLLSNFKAPKAPSYFAHGWLL